MKNNIFIKLLIISCFCLLAGFSVHAETYEVGSGTITASDEFVFKHTGTADSFAGKLTRKSDGFTVYFDIGKMAGTHMHDGKKDQCTYFRKHSIGGLPAITGIETIPDGKRIVTTVAYDPKTDRDPANFWVAIHKDTDIADFLLITTTYQAKNPAPAYSEDGRVPVPETGANDSIQEGGKIYSGDTRIGMNGDVRLDLIAAKQIGEAKASKDIEAGTFRIHEYGKPRPITEETKDPQTGFRIQSVGGCTAPAAVQAEADAYNQVMRDWHAKNPQSSELKK